MRNKNTKMMRTDPNFDKLLEEISFERRDNKIDLDRKIRSDAELTRMMMNCPSFSKVKEELTTMPLKKDLIKLRGDLFK